MTAVLEEIRSLEAARKRGDISEADFLRIRASLMDSIEDATLELRPNPAPAPTPSKPATPQLWHIVLFIALLFGGGTLVASWLIGDMTLALTLAATALAAFTVHAFRNLED